MIMDIDLLLLSAGRRVALINCFRRDADELGLKLRVVATDMMPENSAACAMADVAVASPRCTDAAFVDFLFDLCRREGISLVVPTIDTELGVLSRCAPRLAELGIRTIISSEETIAIARDKFITAGWLARGGVPVPQTAQVCCFDARNPDWLWPSIVKPRGGSSSKGVRVMTQRAYLDDPPGEDCIVQELLTGREFTVNMFFSQSGELEAAVPHWRIETRGGEVSKGLTVRHAELEAVARALAEILPGARGPLCFQAMQRSDGRMAVFEINARFGGGFPIAHRAGAPFTRWLLEEAADLPSTVANNWCEGIRMLRYDEAVFL